MVAYVGADDCQWAIESWASEYRMFHYLVALCLKIVGRVQEFVA
jgi:hypothetical protein